MPENKFQINASYKLGGGIALFLIILVLSIYSIILNWKIECSNPERLITIPKGASAQAVAQLLKSEACLQNETIFKLALTMTMKNKRIIPGRYNFKGISSISQVVNMITSHSRDRIRVTLIEGWSVEQFADELVQKLQIDQYKFMQLNKDFNFIHSLGIDAPALEGFLFPDTYILLKTYAEEDIIKIMANQFKYKMDQLKQGESLNSNLNMREITTLASIIQGEAIHEDEMPIISSVYHNRLRRGMLLQADPTIQYIIPGKARRLYNKDLKVDNPYNTYKYKGLPPGPINNPGLAALAAAANPTETDYLYFVSNGEGRHIFSRTNEEHNQAKLKMKRKRHAKKKI